MFSPITPEEWSAVRLSLQAAGFAVLASLPAAVAMGYLLARGRFSGKWLLEVAVNVPLVLPPVVTGYLLLVCLGRRSPVGAMLERVAGLRLAFTWWGAALAAAVVGFPLMVRAIRLGFQAVDPRLELAARGLGAGRWRTFFTIALPLARRGVLAGGVLAFARGMSEFGATIMLAGNIPGQTRTIPLAIYSLSNRPGGLEQCWRLVALALVLACAALAASEWLEHRGARHERP